MPSQPIKIPFPFGGLTENSGYESGDVQSTRGCLNVSPISSEESRVRGGSRTGITKRYSANLSGTPEFVNRVSGGDGGRVYEYIVVGTGDNIFIGQSVPNSSTYPVSYNEQLTLLTGNLTTESGDTLETELGNSGTHGPSYSLVIQDFNSAVDSDGVSTPYRDRVIVNGSGDYLSSSFDNSITGTISYTTEIRLSDSLIADFTAESIDQSTHYVELSDGSTPVAGTYKIQTVTQDYLVLQGDTSIGTGSVTYSIRVAARDLNPNTPAIDVLTPVAGFIPLGASDVISYRDRLVWAIGRNWYMSRQGDPGDYDYGADPEDPSRAIAGSNSGPGEPGDPINAMVSAGYDYIAFFSDAAVWVMRGDPGFGGQLYQASKVAGCVSRHAWCYGRNTEIYFLGKDGLYMMEPNAGPVTSLSKAKLPRSLRGANRDNFDTNLVYDPEDNCVLIFNVPKDGSTGENYIFDISTQSFWPIRMSSNQCQPMFAETFGGSPSRPRRAVLVCRDGYLRDWYGKTDDGTPISSNVILGPYPAGDSLNIDGFLSELCTLIDEDSKSVTVEIYAASSAEDAVDAAKDGSSPKSSFTVKPGRSLSKRPRVRGNSFCVKIIGSDVWAFESIFGMISGGGRSRRY